MVGESWVSFFTRLYEFIRQLCDSHGQPFIRFLKVEEVWLSTALLKVCVESRLYR